VEEKKAPPPPPPPKVEEKKAPPPPPKVEEKKAPPPPAKVEAKTAPPATAPAKTGSGYDGPFLEWDRASGDWGGQRTKLRESTGFDVQFRLTADWSRTQSGGVDQHEEASRYWADLTTSFDLGKTGCPGGGKVVASWWQMGETGTPILGAFNVESSIANDRRGELAELYLDQPVVRDSIRLKLGKMDPTADIARTIYGQDFLNIGVTFPPPMFPMPRYPDPAVGGELLIQKTALRGPFASLGVFDGSRLDGKLVGERGAATLFGPPPDMFGVMELGYRWLDGRRPLQMSVGGWMHSGDFAEFTGNTGDGNAGLFGTVEGLLWRTHREDPADPRGLYLVMRYASLDEKVSPVERQYVAAVVWRGPLAFRRQDSLGVAYVFADLTDDAGAALPNDTEQIAELYYKIQLAGFLSLSPAAQYVGTPGGGNDDAIVVGLRLLFDF
jgi:carbohydrate-selective porin OprB